GQHHAVRVVQVREPVSVTGGGESSPVGVSGVDGFFGFAGGVGWGRGLAAEGGGEENGEGVAWAHSASPFGGGRGEYGRGRAVASSHRSFAAGGKQLLRTCGARDDMLARFGEGKENCRGAACCAPTHPGEQVKAWHPRLMSCPRLFARH